jgi:hypothetical protein
MAISALKTFVAGEILTASDLNAEFLNIINNGEDLGWPATKAKDYNGQTLQLDADADTTLYASTDDQIDFNVGGVNLFTFDGTTGSSVNGFTWVTGVSGTAPQIQARSGTDANVSINLVPQGSGTVQISGTSIETSGNIILASQVFGRI